jgi:hypothetical protein
LVLGYLLVMGTVTGVICFAGIRSLLELRREQRVLAVQEHWFRSKYPEFGSLEEFAEDVRRGLEQTQARLRAIQQFEEQRIEAVPILVALLEGLPPGTRMTSFSLDLGKKTMEFEVSVPLLVYEQRGRSDNDMVSRWSNDPLLRSRFKTIALVGTRRARGPAGFEYILNFSGILRTGRGESES